MIERRIVNIFTGPPTHKEDDERVVRDFMKQEGRKVVCGGTSANITSRVLKREIVTSVNYADPTVPPTASIKGLDLVTEGVLTLNRVVQLLRRYNKKETVAEDFFLELDKPNGGSMVAKMIIEDCTEIHLFVGKAINSAYQNPGLPFDLGIRQNLVEQLKLALEEMGKPVTVNYY